MAELPNHDAALTETCLESEAIFEGAFLKRAIPSVCRMARKPRANTSSIRAR